MRPDPWNVLKYMCMKYGYENYCYIELGTRSAVCGALTLLHLEVLAVCLIAWYGPANWGPPWSSSWGWWWWWRKGAPPKNRKLLKFSLLRLNFKTIFHFHWQRGTTEHCALLTCERSLGKKQLVTDWLETAQKTRDFTFSIDWYIPVQFNIMRDVLERKNGAFQYKRDVSESNKNGHWSVENCSKHKKITFQRDIIRPCILERRWFGRSLPNDRWRSLQD